MTPAPVPPDGEPDTAGIEAAKQAVYETMPVVLKDLVARSEAEAAIGVPHGAGVPDRWLADVAVRAYLAAGRAAASPDPPDAADLVAAHLRERWPCTCRPGMDGGGVYHAADCNSRREGSQAVLRTRVVLWLRFTRQPTPVVPLVMPQT